MACVPVLHHIHHTPGTPPSRALPGTPTLVLPDSPLMVIGLGIRAFSHVSGGYAIKGLVQAYLIVYVEAASTYGYVQE